MLKNNGFDGEMKRNTQASNRRRFRIAMVCDFFYPQLGGVETHIWSLSQQLLCQGHKVIVITHAYGNRKGVRYLPGPLKVYHCPFLPMTDQDALPTFTATLPLMRSIFIRERIEIVHAHQATSVMAGESVVYASALGIAAVYTDHSLFGFGDVASIILNRVMQVTLSTVDAAICVSHTCRDNLILRTRISPLKVHAIPNAVDPTKFVPATQGNGPSRERVKVVVISRLVFRKGVDLLVGIIPRICSELSQLDFIIGGDGSKRLALQEMVEREQLQDRVEFLGSVPHSQVRDVLVRGHVFLNCSLTESFCIAILEAACCGLLVVSTNVGGVPEVLPPDMVMLSDPNIASMVHCLKQAIARQESDQTAADPWELHRRVERMYSWSKVAQQTTKVYEQVMRLERLTFRQRLTCYRSLGGISGIVACLLAVTVEFWLKFVEWCWPLDDIDVVPDLINPSFDVQERNDRVSKKKS